LPPTDDAVETAEMTTDPPSTDDSPPAPESAHDRHTRELEHSLEVLEETVEHGFVRTLKLAVPIFVGVVLAAVGTYVLGNYLRDRAEARRVERAMRRLHAARRARRAA
jgi:hypothetical protein